MELVSLLSPILAGRVFTTSATWEAQRYICESESEVSVLSDSLQPHGL